MEQSSHWLWYLIYCTAGEFVPSSLVSLCVPAGVFRKCEEEWNDKWWDLLPPPCLTKRHWCTKRKCFAGVQHMNQSYGTHTWKVLHLKMSLTDYYMNVLSGPLCFLTVHYEHKFSCQFTFTYFCFVHKEFNLWEWQMNLLLKCK